MTTAGTGDRHLTRRAQAVLLALALGGLWLAIPPLGVSLAAAVVVVAFRYHARPLLIATTAALVLYLVVLVSAMPV